MMRRRLRLLHTSDVHLGDGLKPRAGEHDNPCLCGLLAIEEAVATHEPDVLLVVGDLFDNGRVKEPLVSEVLRRLGKLPTPVVLLPGNHDVHDDGSLYLRYEHLVLDAGIHLIGEHGGEVLDQLDGIRFWGRAMPEHSPSFQPLGGAPEPGEVRENDAWYVVLAHGHYVPDPKAEFRSSLITPPEIERTGADYVALGHWHHTFNASAGDVTAWYSGSPIEHAGTRNMLVIELDPDTGVNVSTVVARDPEVGCAG
jgi:DNA repair exonuclease SbcCD nuclease subunit